MRWHLAQLVAESPGSKEVCTSSPGLPHTGHRPLARAGATLRATGRSATVGTMAGRGGDAEGAGGTFGGTSVHSASTTGPLREAGGEGFEEAWLRGAIHVDPLSYLRRFDLRPSNTADVLRTMK